MPKHIVPCAASHLLLIVGAAKKRDSSECRRCSNSSAERTGRRSRSRRAEMVTTWRYRRSVDPPRQDILTTKVAVHNPAVLAFFYFDREYGNIELLLITITDCYALSETYGKLKPACFKIGRTFFQCCEIVTIFYGSGSNFCHITVLVPTSDKLRYRLRVWTVKSSFKKIEKNLVFLHSKFIYKDKIDKFIKFVVKF
jgi:hypothetical protein